MSQTFHEGSDAVAIYALIHRTPDLQKLVREPDADIEEVTRAVLLYAGENPETWEEWSLAVVEAVVDYNANNPDEEDE